MPHGLWSVTLIAIAIFIAFTTWRRGREILAKRIAERSIHMDDLASWLSSTRR